MRHGIHIPASVVRLFVLGVIALIGALALREYPEAVRYMKSERM